MSPSVSIRVLILLLVALAGAGAWSPQASGADDAPDRALRDIVMEARDALTDLDVTIELLEDFVREHPEDYGASQRLAALFTARSDLQVASEQWLESLSVPRDPAATAGTVGDIYSHLAHLSYLLALAHWVVEGTPRGHDTLSLPVADPGSSEDAATAGNDLLAEGSSIPQSNGGATPFSSETAASTGPNRTEDAVSGESEATLAGSLTTGPDQLTLLAGTGGQQGSGARLPKTATDFIANVKGNIGSGTRSTGFGAMGAASLGLPAGSGVPGASGESPPLPGTATSFIAAVKKNIMSGAGSAPKRAAPAPEKEKGQGSGTGRPWWHLALLAWGVLMVAILVILGVRAALKRLLHDDKDLQRRLRRAAAPLAGPGAAVTKVQAQESVFRPSQQDSRLAWLWRPLGKHYPLIKGGRAIPVALAAGAGFAGFAWFSIWFLKIEVGSLTWPACALAGAGGVWYALGWLQSRQEAEFVRVFPEIVDQIVRLAGAGVPSVEALSVVAEDAPQPVQPILREVCDALLAGLDTDTALRMATERVQLAEFTMFAAVLRLQRRSGGGISGAFANLSKTLRERRKTALKAHSSTAQTRLTLLVLAIMPVAVLIAQKFIAPTSVEILFGTDQGTTLLQVGTGLIVAGILVARTIAARATR